MIRAFASNLNRFLTWILFSFIAVLYLSHLPSTVQTGDNGELLAAADQLLVAHPPGYPLWIWTHHIWNLLFPIGNVVVKAAVLNILFAVGALLVVFSTLKRNALGAFAVITIAFNPIFWKYAEIPEVFALHIFICCSFVALCFSDKTLKFRSYAIPYPCLSPLVFGLGCSHHHTIVFLFPLLIWQLYRFRKFPSFYVASILGLFVMAGLYISMLGLNVEHIYSWGNLQNLQDVWFHFLRKSYGTLKLTSKDDQAPGAIFLFFTNFLISQAWPLTIVLSVSAYLCFKKRLITCSANSVALLFSILSYFAIFMTMANTHASGFMSEVLLRFFIMPFVLIVLLVGILIRENNLQIASKWTKTAIVASVVFGLSQAYFHSVENDYSNNTIVEDYAINLLKSTSHLPKRILFAAGDTEAFATRFAQVVLNIEPDVVVITDGMAYIDWFEEKLKIRYPNWLTPPASQSSIHFVNDVVTPNAQDFSVIVTINHYKAQDVKSTFYPLGIHLQPGKGYEEGSTSYVPQFRSYIGSVETSPYPYNSFRDLFSKYTYYFLIEGQIQFKAGNLEKAASAYSKAFELYPLGAPALRSLCQLAPQLNRQDSRCNLLSQVEGYFNYYQ